MGTQSLGKSFSQGAAWFSGLRVTSRLIASLQIFILARLLSPTDFGLMGIAMLVLSLMHTFSATGYGIALIQKKDEVHDYLDTIWWVEVVRGVLLALLIFLTAPLVATFFEEPQATSILRVMALYPLVRALSSSGLIILNKELYFRKLVLFQGIQALLASIISVSAALLLQNVWALVISALVNAAIYSLGSYFIYPYRPGLGFNRHKAQELWGFGRWVLGNKILHYLFNDGDDWVVARFLGIEALGLYQTAYNLGNAPSTEVTSVFASVALPIFSKMQDEFERSRKAYLRFMQVVMFLSTPVSIGIALVAQDAVEGLLGEKWAPMVASLQILLIWGWVRSFRATIGPVLSAKGRPDLVAKFTLAKVIVLGTLILPLTLNRGIEGTSWAVVIAALSEIPLLYWSLQHSLGIHPKELALRMLRPIGVALPMILFVWFWQEVLFVNGPVLIRLALAIGLGAVLYLATGILLDRKLKWGLAEDFRTALGYNLVPILDKLRKRFSKKEKSF